MIYLLKVSKKLFEKVLSLINEHQIVYVYPHKSKEEVSIFRLLYPKKEFRWDWSEAADPKLVELWWLKDDLARSKKVVYGRFFKAKPCFVSIKKFQLLLKNTLVNIDQLNALETFIYELLLENSPQSTRMIKKVYRKLGVEVYTRTEWNKAFLGLQKKLLICNLGDSEREHSPMPSTEYAAVEHVFENLLK